MPASIKTRKFSQVTYSISEVSEITGFSRGLIYKEIREGNIKAVKIGRKVMIHQEVLDKMLNI
jgi:excisionase family DNA binding protein